MSLLNAFHFDSGVIPPPLSSSGANLSTGVHRTGTRSLDLFSFGDWGAWVRYPFDTPLSEFYVQFAFRYGSGSLGNTKFFRWDDTGNILGGLKLNGASHLIELYTGNFASLVATGSTPLSVDTWYVIELHIVIGDSGSITVKVDLNEDITFVGDTKPGAGTAVSYIYLGSFYSAHAYYDDFIIHDTAGSVNNSWPNGAKVAYIKPTGDGSTKEWTPSTGTDHYALIDDVPPSATDYLQSDTAVQVDKFTLESLPGDAQQVLAVIPEVHAFKGSGTSPTQLAIGVEVDAVQGYSSNLDLALSQGLVRKIMEEKPGGGAFSVANVNSMKLLLKSAG